MNEENPMSRIVLPLVTLVLAFFLGSTASGELMGIGLLGRRGPTDTELANLPRLTDLQSRGSVPRSPMQA